MAGDMCFRGSYAGVDAGSRWLRWLVRAAAAAFVAAWVGCSGGTPDELPGGERLFDGRSLAGWVPSGFEAEGPVRVENPFQGGPGAIVIRRGTTLSGVTSTRGAALPRMNYEVALEAMRIEGGDFFCGLTFPVGRAACTFVAGGWGGTVVGLSNVDRLGAVENETHREQEFEDRRWYRIRVRVTEERVEAWIDDVPVVDLKHAGRTLSLRPGDIQKARPLGISTYMTTAAVRDIRLRRW